MSLLKNFEKETGLSIKNLSEEKLVDIMENEKYEHFFKHANKAIELFDEMLEEIENENFRKELFTVRESFNLSNIGDLLEDLFITHGKEKISNEVFSQKIEQNFHSDDPLYVLSTLMCVILSKYEFALEEYFETFKDSVNKIKNIFQSLGRIENSYKYRTDVIDLLYNLQQEYFYIYEKDILEGADWLEAEVDSLTEFEESINPTTFNSINLEPEELGLLDITKLSKEGA